MTGDILMQFRWTIAGTVVAESICLYHRRRLASWWRALSVENGLQLAGLLLFAFVFVALGLIFDNPGSDLKDPKTANEQRKTVVQIVGGLLGAGALLFAALRAIQTDQQIKQAANLKAADLLQSRWHNALELLGKETEKGPQLESRVAAILILRSLELPPEKGEIVRETICRYVHIHAKEPDAGNKPKAEDDPDPPLRPDIECCCGTLRQPRLGMAPNPMYMHQVFLPGADLHGADLRGWRLAGAILRHVNLLGAKLDGAILNGADLSGAVLDENTSMAGASLVGCTLNATFACGVDFSGADLTNAVVSSDTEFSNCKFHREKLAGVNLQLAKTKDLVFTGAEGKKPDPEPERPPVEPVKFDTTKLEKTPDEIMADSLL